MDLAQHLFDVQMGKSNVFTSLPSILGLKLLGPSSVQGPVLTQYIHFRQ